MILILADSQGLPRGKGWGNVPYEATYPYLLDRALKARLGSDAPLVLDRSARGRTLRHVEKEWEEEVELKGARTVVLHIGGSDCAPRIFLPREQEWLARIPSRKVRRLVSRFEQRHRRALLTWMPQRVCVALMEFERKLSLLAGRARRAGRELIFVDIAYPTGHITDLSPGLRANIDAYNAVLARIAATEGARLLVTQTILPGDPALWTVDGVHFNPAGHRRLAEALVGMVVSRYHQSARWEGGQA